MKTAPPYGHEEWFRIRTHEIDQHKLITVPALQMLMQEASMQNVIKLKLSVWDLEDQKISWVLLRKELKINRRPGLGEKIKVVTYPAGFDRVFAYRDFWVYSEQDEVLAYASSTWTLLNTVSRKLQRIPNEMLALQLIGPEDRLPAPQTKLILPDQLSNCYTYQIRNFDLDWNAHVNNVVLSKLMLQAVPMEHQKNRKLISFDFHIKNECYLDEAINVQVAQKEDFLFHQLKGKEEKIIALGRTAWETSN